MEPDSPELSAWHEGELAVQRRVGVGEVSARGIRSYIPEALLDFLNEPRLIVFASVDSEQRTWASLRVAEPGFLRVLDPLTLASEPANVDGDSLLKNLQDNPNVGMLIVDLATRRRVRINGEAEVLPDDGMRIHARQVYGNCPQYIQLRVKHPEPSSAKMPSLLSRAASLSAAQQEWIGRADTLFIASAHPDRGADASHRGGNPGFIKVDGSGGLIIPDYSGNNMFNTLGNISVNPHAGLLLPDFEQGRTLQLAGKATISWDADRSQFPGAQRLLMFDIQQTVEIEYPALANYALREYSPFNPRF